jgi:alpha-L-rhamnosidase
MKPHFAAAVAAACVLATLVATGAAAGSTGNPPICVVDSLKVERRGQQGFAVATAKPRFSWIIQAQDDSVTNITQDSYQLQVLKTAFPTSAADVLWDTGRVASTATLEIEYAGPALVSEQRVWWRVQSWTVGGTFDSGVACCLPVSSGWSSISFFRVGRLNASDWTGEWIAQPGAQVPNPTNSCSFYDDRPNSLFRKTFTVPPTAAQANGAGAGKSNSSLVEAVLHITGLGYYAAYVNGQPVGSSALDPGFTT